MRTTTRVVCLCHWEEIPALTVQITSELCIFDLSVRVQGQSNFDPILIDKKPSRAFPFLPELQQKVSEEWDHPEVALKNTGCFGKYLYLVLGGLG